ncbi:MAG: YncE family protein [Geminicoccales bacterium]
MTRNRKNWISVATGIAAAVFGALAAHAEPLVYVPMGSENKIIIVDVDADKVIGAIDGVAAAHGLAITPNGEFLIAGSYDARSVGSLPAKPKDVSEDDHAAHHKAPSIKANENTEAEVSSVSIISTTNHKAVRAIDVPGAVHHVSVSPDGQFAAVTRPNQNALSIIDLASFKVVANPKTGSLPNYSVFSPDSKIIYVSNAGDDNVAIIEVEGWRSKATIAVGASPEHVVLNKGGSTLYVNNVEDGTVSIVDTASRKTIKTIKIGSSIHGIDLSDDGNSLFVAALGDDKIVQIDLPTGTARSLSLEPEPYHLTTIVGAGKLYVSSAEQPNIWVIDQKRLEVVTRVNIGGNGHQMVLTSRSAH